MDDRTTYETDFYAWSQRQASVLRDLSGRRDLPNELDLEHVAGEIEDVGRAELNAVQSYVRLILVHLIKGASVSAAPVVDCWRKEVLGFHSELVTRYTRSMGRNIDLDALWCLAVKEAEAALALHGQGIPPNLPHRCPVELSELVALDFDFRVAVERIRASTRDE